MANNKSALFAAVLALGMFSVAGCGPKETADNNGGGTTEGAMERAGKTVDQSAETVKEGTKEAVKETGEAVGQAGEAVGGAVVATGEAVKEGTKEAVKETGEAVGVAGEAVGGAVKGVAKETQDAGQALKMTTGIKNALIASKAIDASTLNVDTDAELDTVIIKGTVPTAAKQKEVTTVAQRALNEMGSKFRLKNQVTVAK